MNPNEIKAASERLLKECDARDATPEQFDETVTSDIRAVCRQFLASIPEGGADEPVAAVPMHISFRREVLRRAADMNGSDFAGNLVGGSGDNAEDLARTVAIVLAAYEWTVDPTTGNIVGLVAGDMGYAATSLKVDEETRSALAPAPSPPADVSGLVVYLSNPPLGGNLYFGSCYSLEQVKKAASALASIAAERDQWAAQAMKEDDCRKMWQERAEKAEAEWNAAYSHGRRYTEASEKRLALALDAANERADTATAELDQANKAVEALNICIKQDDEQMAALTAELAKVREALAEERAIVDRIWDQLGRPSYEALRGRSIYDLIDDLKAQAARAVLDAKP